LLQLNTRLKKDTHGAFSGLSLLLNPVCKYLKVLMELLKVEEETPSVVIQYSEFASFYLMFDRVIVHFILIYNINITYLKQLVMKIQ